MSLKEWRESYSVKRARSELKEIEWQLRSIALCEERLRDNRKLAEMRRDSLLKEIAEHEST